MRDNLPEGHKWGRVEFYLEETELCRCKKCGIIITRSSVSMEHLWKLAYNNNELPFETLGQDIPESCEAVLMDKALK